MNYDLVVIVRSGEDQEKAKQKISTLLEKEGFTVSEMSAWGKRKFAYPLKKQTEGLYFSTTIKSDKAKPAGLLAKLKLDETVLRTLVLKKEAVKSPKAEIKAQN